ncbi:MAG: diaminopimelate epimerase [Limnochordia bacterium]|nr:diaminopimelate epimerase [Bacillota bacterium]
MEFIKMHGLGNDFILVYGNEIIPSRGGELARRLCDRRHGIGADGLLFLSSRGDSFAMRIFNADGSEADMCGNALLCAARYLVETDKGKAKATIHTLAGPREVSILPGGLIRAGMGRPEWDPGQIPVLSDKSLVLKEPIMLGGCLLEVSCVSLGNPHCIVHVPDLGMVDLARLGPRLERHPIFPQKTNVEFVQVIARDRLAVVVWERGVGATMACGTGACAAALVSLRLGLADRQVRVLMPGGELLVECLEDVYLTGTASLVYRGWVDLGRDLGFHP